MTKNQKLTWATYLTIAVAVPGCGNDQPTPQTASATSPLGWTELTLLTNCDANAAPGGGATNPTTNPAATPAAAPSDAGGSANPANNVPGNTTVNTAGTNDVAGNANNANNAGNAKNTAEGQRKIAEQGKAQQQQQQQQQQKEQKQATPSIEQKKAPPQIEQKQGSPAPEQKQPQPQQKEQQQQQQSPVAPNKSGGNANEGTNGNNATPAIDVASLNQQMEQGGLKCAGQGTNFKFARSGQLTLPNGQANSLSAERAQDIQTSADRIFAAPNFGQVTCEAITGASDNESIRAMDSNGQMEILLSVDQAGQRRCFRGDKADIDRLHAALRDEADRSNANNAPNNAGSPNTATGTGTSTGTSTSTGTGTNP